MKLGQRKGEATFSDMIFEQLKDPDLYCSLGEELSYYQKISKLPLKVRNKILSTLGDLVYDRSRIGKFEGDECYKLSLLRDQSSLEALETAGSRYFGQIEKKNLEFVAKFSIFGDTAHHLNFDFNEHRGLPHRVNLIIGSNAVGKTQVLAKLAQAMTRFAPDKEAKKSVKDTIRDGEISPYPSFSM
ncbi:hypothetical protein [Bdellovibrio bacteriovorus]|uniref:hypothetical protein n=1 Tax=Bdellovibrio bacteriovorus TaxID=959 RepID=UPI0035A6F079